jgi:hypothetical protein
MVTAVFAEILKELHHTTELNPESRNWKNIKFRFLASSPYFIKEFNVTILMCRL